MATIPNPLEEVIKKLDECKVLLQSIPNAGECSTVRWKIYGIIQAQQGDCNGALYKELRCSIHLGLIGENRSPVTLPCGHNYCIDGIWQFPMDVNQPEIITGDSDGNLILYNLVLDKGHIVLINDIECVTLGHNIQDDVVRHQFFGTNKIIDDLKTFDGWSGGYITLTDDNRKVIRDINSNEVVKYERIY